MVKELIPTALKEAVLQDLEGKGATEDSWIRRAYLKLLLEVWVQAYLDGEMTVEKMLINSKRSVERMVDQLKLSDRERVSISTSYLGYATWSALDGNRKKRSPGNKVPTAVKAFSGQVVDMFHEKGFTKNISKDTTAFEKAAEFISIETRLSVTPSQVFDWYYKHR